MAGAEIYLSCDHPRQASKISSLAYYRCHLPICSGLPLSLVSPCSPFWKGRLLVSEFTQESSSGGKPTNSPTCCRGNIMSLWREAWNSGETHSVMMGFRTHYPKNMAPWHIEYLKEHEKQNLKNDRYKDSDFYPEKDHKTLMWEVSSLYREDSYLQRQRKAKRNLNKQALLSFPTLSFCPITFSHHSSSNLVKNTQV